MLNKIIRYCKGYLRIRISGQAVERFINACSYKGIHIWELSAYDLCYEMNITIKDFRKLKPVIRKTKTKVMIVERTGFPFFIQKYRNRKLLFTGFFLCTILIFYLSSYIWCIRIEGNTTNSTENLIGFLSSLEIRPGIKSQDVNCALISRRIRENYDDIIWVSTSLEGSDLVIKIKENETSSEPIETSNHIEPYDIVADEDYQINDIIIRKGISQIKEGQFVKKGDLLVSGQIPVYNDAKEIISYQYCVADADIYGRKNIVYEDTISRSTYNKKYSNIEKQEYYIKLKDYRLILGGIKNEYASFEEISKQLSFGKVTVGIRKAYPYEKEERNYSKKELQKILTSNFQYYCQELEKKGVVILKNNVKIDTWSDKAKAKGTLTVEMPIGRKVKSEIIETGDYIDGNDGNNN